MSSHHARADLESKQRKGFSQLPVESFCSRVSHPIESQKFSQELQWRRIRTEDLGSTIFSLGKLISRHAGTYNMNVCSEEHIASPEAGDPNLPKECHCQWRIQFFGLRGQRSFDPKGFSLKIAWKWHDLKKILEARGGPGPQGPLGSASDYPTRIWTASPMAFMEQNSWKLQ